MFPGQEENRETFFARFEGLDTPEELIFRIEQAYDTAKEALRHEHRRAEFDSQGNPLRSFEHSRDVALALMDNVGCLEPRLVCGALLHDTVEDSRYVTIRKLRIWFGSESLARLVGLLTKEPKEGYEDRLLNELDEGRWGAVLIKMCDRFVNMTSLKNCNRAFQMKQGDETRRVYIPMFERLVGILPEQYRENAQAMLDTIRIMTALYESPADDDTEPEQAEWIPPEEGEHSVIIPPHIRRRLKETQDGGVGDDLSESKDAARKVGPPVGMVRGSTMRGKGKLRSAQEALDDGLTRQFGDRSGKKKS